MPEYGGSERRDGHWHLDKKVPLMLILSVFLIVGQQIYAQGMAATKFENLEKQVTLGTTDRIRKDTVIEMFNSRDTQITGINEDIKDIKASVAENNRLLIRILQNTHIGN